MLLLKAQKELINDTTSRIIILSGVLGSGKTTALAMKALESETSIILDDNFELIKKVDISILKELAGKDFIVTDPFHVEAKGSTILMSTYNKIIEHDLENHDLALLNNCEFMTNEMLKNVLSLLIHSKIKQIIVSISPLDLKKDSTIHDLVKHERIIHCSVYDNPHLSQDYINSLKEYTDVIHKYKWRGL